MFDEKTSRHYFERYRQGGVPALREDNYAGAEPKLDERQMRQLDGYLEEHILPNAKAVGAHTNKWYWVYYSIGGVIDLLHRRGFSYQKPTHVPGKQDPVQQQIFPAEYKRLKARQGPNDPIYFADATPSITAFLHTAGSKRDGKKNSRPMVAGSVRISMGPSTSKRWRPRPGFTRRSMPIRPLICSRKSSPSIRKPKGFILLLTMPATIGRGR